MGFWSAMALDQDKQSNGPMRLFQVKCHQCMIMSGSTFFLMLLTATDSEHLLVVTQTIRPQQGITDELSHLQVLNFRIYLSIYFSVNFESNIYLQGEDSSFKQRYQIHIPKRKLHKYKYQILKLQAYRNYSYLVYILNL